MSTTNKPPIVLTKASIPDALGIIGPADILHDAFNANQPITLDGKLAGEVVYLGHARQTFDQDADGVRVERIGLDRLVGETPKFPGVTVAVYLVDLTRLDQAPTIADLARKARNQAAATAISAEVRAQAEEDRLEHSSEDGA